MCALMYFAMLINLEIFFLVLKVLIKGSSNVFRLKVLRRTSGEPLVVLQSTPVAPREYAGFFVEPEKVL